MQYRDLTSIDEVNALGSVTDPKKLANEVIWQLQYSASTAEGEVKQAAIAAINSLAAAQNITTGSNTAFYEAKAKGENQFFTVPAINSRMATFHTVRAAVRAADRLNVPHVIFEIALSEIGYTAQEQDEYAALVKAAYISLGITNREIYLQADHYQLDPKKYSKDAKAEVERIQKEITKALEAGVYNIDIDTSKFETADISKSDEENQAENARLTAELLMFIREYETENKLPCTISVGAEVGEVGGENTKYPQVNAFLSLVAGHVKKHKHIKGFSKVAINVGSAHGGVLGPDGQPLDSVPLNFQAHHDLYMNGVDPLSSGKHVLTVQHGASTLPHKYFSLFPAMHVAEIHLATGFQNIVWEVLEKEDAKLYKKMKDLTHEKFGDKIKEHKTEAIGFMKERKRTTILVKKDLLLSPAMNVVEAALEQEFTTIFYAIYNLLALNSGHVEQGDRAD
jgi:uncharacterized protein (UPF0276 family)